LLGIDAIEEGPVALNINNHGALKLAKNPIYHKQSKHIEIEPFPANVLSAKSV